jgi:hypothetical protein
MIDTSYLQKCVLALDRAYSQLQNYSEEEIEFEIYRSAIVKEFEIILEQSGKLLKKVLKPYFHSPKAVDRLYFKDVFREAGLRDILTLEEVERWLEYRDFAEKEFANQDFSKFISDSNRLIKAIQKHDN